MPTDERAVVFDYLLDHSVEQDMSGATSLTKARVIDGAVLVAAKLHSARETDLRDVVAVAQEIDLTAVTPHLHRGNEEALREQLEHGVTLLESEALRHGFRSDFGASSVSEETLERVQSYLERQIE